MATDRAPKGLDRIQLAGAYVGSVLGAGFASGQEHAAFFLKFGAEGFLALGVAGLMFAVFGAWLLALAHRYQTCSHTHLLEVIAPQPLATLFDALLSFFAFASLAVMMAGAGALYHALTGGPALYGVFTMAGATLGMLLLRIDRMLQVNALITAAMILVLLAVGFRSLPHALGKGIGQIASAGDWVPENWPAAAVLYGSYNLALTVAVFGSLGCDIQERREAILAGVGGGVILTVLSAGVLIAVASVLPEGARAEIPMLLAAGRLGPSAQRVYAGVIGTAMWTTAVASAYALARRLSFAVGGSGGLAALLVTGAALPIALLGFGRLVGTLYPLIGYAGAGCLILAGARSLSRSGKRPS